MKRHAVPVGVISRIVLFVLLGLQSLPAMAAGNACPVAAQQYWKAFRGALLRGNITEVANATRFPFRVSGTLNQSDMRSIERSQFTGVLPALLNADPKMSSTPTTMMSLVKATPRLPPSFCSATGNQFRAGTWVFDLTAEGWRFSEGFVDE
jgi:hypothetical protein